MQGGTGKDLLKSSLLGVMRSSLPCPPPCCCFFCWRLEGDVSVASAAHLVTGDTLADLTAVWEAAKPTPAGLPGSSRTARGKVRGHWSLGAHSKSGSTRLSSISASGRRGLQQHLCIGSHRVRGLDLVARAAWLPAPAEADAARSGQWPNRTFAIAEERGSERRLQIAGGWPLGRLSSGLQKPNRRMKGGGRDSTHAGSRRLR